jgi:hypothetical protein
MGMGICETGEGPHPLPQGVVANTRGLGPAAVDDVSDHLIAEWGAENDPEAHVGTVTADLFA